MPSPQPNPKFKGTLYNPYEEHMKEMAARENVTREEFEKRNNSSGRLDKVEAELANMRGLLKQVVDRLNAEREVLVKK
jgi:Tfp pilus assembly protein PilO